MDYDDQIGHTLLMGVGSDEKMKVIIFLKIV